jgi:hypothetical protein
MVGANIEAGDFDTRMPRSFRPDDAGQGCPHTHPPAQPDSGRGCIASIAQFPSMAALGTGLCRSGMLHRLDWARPEAGQLDFPSLERGLQQRRASVTMPRQAADICTLLSPTSAGAGGRGAVIGGGARTASGWCTPWRPTRNASLAPHQARRVGQDRQGSGG